MKHSPQALNEIHDQQLERAYDDAGKEEFRHPVDILEPEDEANLHREFADLLTPVFSYIAKGRLTGTMDARSWVVLYCTRTDMVGGESIRKFAARQGITPARVQALINEFRDAVPGFRPTHAAPRRAHGKGGKAKAKATPVVRNLFPQPNNSGSEG